MDRTCSICQTVTYDDEETICSNCGADLPPVDDEAIEDVEDDIEELSLDLNGLLDDEEDEEEEEETGDWDTGVIGGEATDEDLIEEEEEAEGPDIEMDEGSEVEEEPEEEPEDEEEEVVEEVTIEEGQMLCPSCDEVVEDGIDSCPNCAADLSHIRSCPACAKGIDKIAEICPHCYTDLNTFEPEDEEGEPEEDEIVEEEEEDEEIIDEDLDEDEAGEPEKEEKKDKKKSRWGRRSKEDEEPAIEGEPDLDDEVTEELDIDDDDYDDFDPKEEKKRDKEDEKRKKRLKKEEIDEMMEEGKQEGFFNYYNLSLITLFFYVFLAIFILVEFILIVTNITSDTNVPSVTISLGAVLGNISSISLLLFALILSMSDAILHMWDRKINLLLSLIPSGVMAAGLAFDAAYSSALFGTDLPLILLLFLLFFMMFLDIFLIFFKYPVVLEDNDRSELELFLEKEEELEEIHQKLEEEYEQMIEEEEEKLRMKDQEIHDIKTELDTLSDQIQQEEEKLRMKEEEVSAIRAELELKTQEMAEEEEKLRMKEQEMESLIQTELEKRAEDMMMEEEEKLHMKEEELIQSRNELDIQKNLLDDNREKLRMKEQEMMNLRTELENQMRHRMEEEDRLKLKEAATKMLDRGKQKRVLFPFTAMVGQEKMKKALTLNAIYPEIGGVLIRGQKGTGKSVSVRGLAEVLPDIEVTGCKFNCDPKDDDKFCTECAARHKAGNLATHQRQVQVVDLPLNVTEDRLVGSIDIEKVLTEGVKSFEPGILAEAHRGILYVDEINLLDDYIVDILLDAASSGIVTIEREGISLSHESRFIIVGSMNPEEGELRPQILDRIALQTDVIGIKEVAKRIDIVRRREEFTADAEGFREKYEASRAELVDKIERANELLPKVTTPQRMFKLIAQICLDFNVDGHRADIIIERAARANAAFEGRMETSSEDVIAAASMALPHRMRRRTMEDEEEFSEEMLRRLVDKREAELD